MTRQILRFPVGQQFRKILEDDHEWCIITDLRLNIKAAVRGGKLGYKGDVLNTAYNKIIKGLPKGKTINIYHLHTHPGTLTSIPSENDLNTFINTKGDRDFLKSLGIIERGYGIITPYNILIIKLPEHRGKLRNIRYAPLNYREKAIENIRNKLNLQSTPETEKFLRTMQKLSKTDPEFDKTGQFNQLYDNAHSKAFREIIKEEPDIRTQTVRRTHRGTMRRWRR